MKNSARDPLLDLLRLAGAVLVVLGHAKALFLAPAWQMQLSAAGKAFYLLHALGHSAVVVFFVLSGYLVGGVTARKVVRGKFDPADYWAPRVSRLWTVLLPCLVIGILFDLATMRFFPHAFQTASYQEIGLFTKSVAERMNFQNALGTALFLNTLVVDAPGSAVQMWSLAYEWWYYAIAGLGAMAVSQSGKRKALPLIILGAVVAFLALLNWDILAYLLIWLLGTAAFSLNVPEKAAKWTMTLSALFGFACIGASLLNVLPTFLADLSLGAAVAAFLVGRKANWEARAQMVRSSDLLAKLADSSFTLYACHMPILLLLACIVSPAGRIAELTPQALAPVYLSVLFVCGLAVALASVTEWRTPLVRKWLFGQLAARQNPSEPAKADKMSA